MTKRIEMTFSNGAVYSIPAKVVAENRADYYATKDDGDYDAIFENEMWILDDELELLDWMRGHMNWEDVEEYAKLERVTGIDKSDEFINVDAELIN